MVSRGLYVGVLCLSLALIVGLIYWIVRDFEGREIRWYTLVMVSLAGWTLFAILQLFVPWSVTFPVLEVELRPAILAYKLKIAFAWTTGPAWLTFAYYYTNSEDAVTTPRTLAMWGSYGLLVVLVLTDHLAVVPYTGAVWSGWGTADVGFATVTAEEGSVYRLGLLFVYALITAGILHLVGYARSARRISRRQMLIVVLGALVPLAVDVLTRLQALGLQDALDLTPIAFVGFNVMVLYALFGEQMFEVSAFSRDHIMGSIQDVIVSVDDDLRIVDYNESAAALFGLEDACGSPVEAVIPEVVTDSERPAFADEVTWITDDDRRHLNITASEFERGDEVRGYTLVVQDVTELRERTESLEQQTEQLDQFASTVSHDLRNPLTTAMGITYELQGTEYEDTGQEIRGQMERMEEMIDSALTLAREGQAIEERQMEFLSAVLAESWDTARTGAATLRVECPDTVQVYTDEGRLRNLFENLFRNAVDHGSPDATVWVGTTAEGFYVEDDGPGIPDDDKGSVFDSGFTTGGTGLGLAIVKQIADAHDWDVHVEDGRDGGAKFVFTGVDLVETDRTAGVGDDVSRTVSVR